MSKVGRVYRHSRRVIYRESEIEAGPAAARIGRYARLSVYYGQIYLHLANGTAEYWETKIPSPPPANFRVGPGEYWIGGPFGTAEIPASWLGSYSAGDPLPADWITAEAQDPAVASARPPTPEDFIGRI